MKMKMDKTTEHIKELRKNKRLREARVRAYTRHSKTGKMVLVGAHERTIANIHGALNRVGFLHSSSGTGVAAHVRLYTRGSEHVAIDTERDLGGEWSHTKGGREHKRGHGYDALQSYLNTMPTKRVDQPFKYNERAKAAFDKHAIRAATRRSLAYLRKHPNTRGA